MSGAEKRRFPRIKIPEGYSAQVIWPNHETSEISDVSFKGLAAVLPGLFDPKIHKSLDLQIRLGKAPAFPVSATVIWRSQEMAGLMFPELPVEGHQELGDFLQSQLAAMALKKVDARFYNPRETFNQWYQAPGIDIFVWLNEAQAVETVELRADEINIKLGRGRKNPAFSDKAMLIVAQLGRLEPAIAEFLRTLEGR